MSGSNFCWIAAVGYHIWGTCLSCLACWQWHYILLIHYTIRRNMLWYYGTYACIVITVELLVLRRRNVSLRRFGYIIKIIWNFDILIHLQRNIGSFIVPIDATQHRNISRYSLGRASSIPEWVVTCCPINIIGGSLGLPFTKALVTHSL